MIGQTQVKGLSPEIFQCCAWPKISYSGSQQRNTREGERVDTYRGLRPWQVIGQRILGLGRAAALRKEAPNKPERRGGGMAQRQAD